MKHCASFPKIFRIRKRADFRVIAQKRTRFYGHILVIDSLSSEYPRLGISVPRSFGGAVRRNRFKRLVREVFRTVRAQLPPFDMVVLPKKGGDSISLEIIKKDLLKFAHESQYTTAKSS